MRPAVPAGPVAAEPLQILIAAAFPPASGPGLKYAAWGRAFETLGCSCTVRTELVGADRLAAWIGERPWDVVILRADERSAGARTALRAARRAGAAVVAEVPTPHRTVAREIARSPLTPRLRARYLWRLVPVSRLWREADLLLETGPDSRLWRLASPRPRVTVTNGADLDRVPRVAGWRERTTLRLVAAASPAHWNGFERVVRALPAEPRAQLTLLGAPEPYARVLRLAAELGVADRVTARGHLTGAAYAEALTAADLGVSSLALHRIGGSGLSPLKTRDYLASGLPVLMAGDDPDLRDAPPFAFRAPDGDVPLDLGALAAWLEELRRSSVDGAAIRRFARERFDYVPRARAVLDAVRATQRRDLPARMEGSAHGHRRASLRGAG